MNSPRRTLALAHSCLVLALFSGCAEGSPEGLIVSLQTDFVPVVEFDRVVVAVDGAREEVTTPGASDTFARPRPVASYAGLANGRRDVEVSLFDGGRVVASRTVSVQFRGSQLVNVVIARSCAGIVCDEGDTCVGGECVSPRCATGTEPECPRPQCSSPADCASSASCVEPSCVAGICLETSGDGCAATEACVPGVGCVTRSRGDAGAQPDAASAMDAGDASGDAPSTDAPAPTFDAVVPSDAGFCDPAINCMPNPCETATCVAGRCERARICGEFESCCSGVCAPDCALADCAGRPVGEVCRPSAGDCDVEERCDGGAMCPPDGFAAASVTCRASTGECDVAERCGGASADCPIDRFVADGTACAAGSCDGLGTCSSACVPGASCSTGNPCERGRRECPSGACVSAGPAPAGIVCRDAMGPCDLEETCTGSSTTCPTDRRVAVGTECRATRGICDRAEVCDGGVACPTDVREPAGTMCRAASAGGCDVPEVCTGSSDTCPINGFAPSSTVCRPQMGDCDVPDRCTGVSASCPIDAVASFGTPCRAAMGACDVAEACNGVSTTCPANGVAPPGTTCRAALGSCDVPEACDGSSTTCPPDPGRRFGDACCAGASCSGGSACLGSRCAVFGGSFAIEQFGALSEPCSGNPLAGGACACPAGFTAQQLEDVDWGFDEGNGFNQRLYVCVAAGAPSTGTDFGGAWSRTTTGNPFASGCANACTFPATTTGGCSCPSGGAPSTLTSIHAIAGSLLDCEREVTYCDGTAAPLSFGGAYWRYVPGSGDICDGGALPVPQHCLPNPETGTCSCPTGFAQQVTLATQRRTIERGFGPEMAYCYGELVVCVRAP